jgi:hypothetical protein
LIGRKLWRDEVEHALIKREQILKCVLRGIYERAPQRGIGSYVAFLDASLGSGKDSAAVCIGHWDAATERVIIDAVREQQPPYSPEQNAKEFSELIRSYGITNCLADHVGGAAIAEQFSKWGVRIDYQKPGPTAPPKSELYLAEIQTFNSTRVGMLDDSITINQMCSLVRKNQSGGRPLIDAEGVGHDDRSNVVAGVIWMLLSKLPYNLAAMGNGDVNSNSIMAARQDRAEGKRTAPIGERLNFKTQAEFNKWRMSADRKNDPEVFLEGSVFGPYGAF